jgi:leucyl-tRNA synthetase
MEYNFNEIEKKWQDWWTANEIYKVSNDSSKPKYYVLDMFPYRVVKDCMLVIR